MLAKIIWFYNDFHWDISILVINSKHFFENLHIFANIWTKGQNQKLKPFVIQNHTRKRRICCQIYKIFFGSNVSWFYPYYRAFARVNMRMHRQCERIYSSDVCVKNTQIYVVVRYAFGEGPVIWVKSANIWTKKYFINLTTYSSFSGMILYYKRF